ncbi:hypothetical protein OLP47_07095 [Campylobacter jejuni]|nr:hypothetical protein [Campylobacter jejuni]
MIHEGAIFRVTNHLSYKLGQAIINSQTTKAKLILPFRLMSILIKHKIDTCLFKAICRSNPHLNLPPIEGYADYYKALQIQESKTYKLGRMAISKPWKIYSKG